VSLAWDLKSSRPDDSCGGQIFNRHADRLEKDAPANGCRNLAGDNRSDLGIDFRAGQDDIARFTLCRGFAFGALAKCNEDRGLRASVCLVSIANLLI